MRRHNQFEEQFQDSEANFSEVAPQPTDERSQGAPMQLLKVQRNGKIELNEQALNLIASCGQEVGFVSLVGKMRTGKSCLLNRLLGLAGRGFRVDASVSSCTQGIWIWSQPVFNEALNCFVFFMDTQGCDSLEKDAENDAKIFTLSLLISSYLVYNSVGCIDERSLSELEMVAALTQHIRADQRLSEKQNQEQLFRYMPKFLWLLRDVTLKIEDERGRKISPTQYLQNCLNQQGSGSLEANKKIRKSLLTFFKDRECMTLVRPVGDEGELQRLDTIPDHALRREFVQSVAKLKDKLIRGCGPKTFGGEPVIGPVMVDLIESFVESFNTGKVPSIRSAWQQIAEDEGAAAFNAAVVKYEQIFRAQFPDDSPKGDDEIRKILGKLREQSLKEFDQHCFNKKHDEMRMKLRNLIDEKETNIIEINRNVCQARNNEILKDLAKKMKNKIASNSYTGKKDEMQRDFDEIISQYNREAKGPNKAEILAEFVRTINPLFFTIDSTDKIKKEEEENKEKLKNQELQRMLKLRDKENESLRQQLKAKENQPLPTSQRPKPQKKGKERQTQGCCSGDKCLVM